MHGTVRGLVTDNDQRRDTFRSRFHEDISLLSRVNPDRLDYFDVVALGVVLQSDEPVAAIDVAEVYEMEVAYDFRDGDPEEEAYAILRGLEDRGFLRETLLGFVPTRGMTRPEYHATAPRELMGLIKATELSEEHGMLAASLYDENWRPRREDLDEQDRRLMDNLVQKNVVALEDVTGTPTYALLRNADKAQLDLFLE